MRTSLRIGFITCVILLISIGVFSQSTLKGKIETQDKEVLQGVTVAIQKLNRSVITNEKGEYEFANIAAGKHVISVSHIGFENSTRTVNVQDGESRVINIILVSSSDELQNVEVTGRKETGYKNTSSFIGTKTATPLKEVPQAISYVTKEVMAEQLAFKTSDAIKNISGVNQSSYNNSDFVLRGFRASSTMVNGLRISTRGWAQNLLPYVERVEVIKGPASALFANTDPGGTVNTVTKKPLAEKRNAISFTTGSWNTYRVSTDFTGPMNDSKTLLYRLNLAYQNAQSFRVLQEGDAVVIAPSISFLPDSKTRINFDLVYQKNNGRLDRGQPIFGATSGTDLYSTPISFAIGKRNDFHHETNLFSTLSLQREITKFVSFNVSYMKSMYEEDLLEHRTSNSYGVDADGNAIPTKMQMQTIRRQRKNYIDNLSAYFNFDINTGAVNHKLLVGYDRIQENFPLGNSTYNASGFLNAAGTGTISTYRPANRNQYMIVNNVPVRNVPDFDLANPDYSISEISRYINVSAQETPSKYFVNGVYIQEQLSWNKFRLLLGLRQEFYTDVLNYTKENARNVQQKALIPRIGLVYTPIEPISVYATYVEGYQPQSAGTIGDQATYGGPFDPLISNMIEAGVKSEWFQKRLAVTLAAYKIEQNNILMNANDPGNPDLLRQIGQQQAKGIEMDIYGKITSNLNVTANFSLNETTITESENKEEIGNLLPNAPKTQGGIWVRYNFKLKALEGLGIAAGTNYSGKRATSSAILELPSYTVANAAIFYTIDKFRISANLNNVFNKIYWVGGFDFNRLFPGAPRNWMATVAYTF